MDEKHRESISKLAKSIINFKFKPSMTLKEVEKGFYKLMRKHGIKEGSKIPGEAGRTVCNFEWTMCRDLFYSRLNDWFTFRGFLVSTPKDLECYEIEQ